MKRTEKVNFRVEVYPYYELTPLEDCNAIAKSIRRHVDDVGDVVVRFDFKEVCQYCGYVWGGKDSNYNGGCCDKDEENNPTQSIDYQQIKIC